MGELWNSALGVERAASVVGSASAVSGVVSWFGAGSACGLGFAVVFGLVGFCWMLWGRAPALRACGAALVAVLCGWANMAVSREANGALPQECLDGGRRLYYVEVQDFGKETAKSWKKTVKVLGYAASEDSVARQPVRALLCLYFKKDSLSAALAPGDRLALWAAPEPINDTAYAGYARYMRRRYIYASAYVPAWAWQRAQGSAAASVSGDEVATLGAAACSTGAASTAPSTAHPLSLRHRLLRVAHAAQSRLGEGLEHPCLGERERGIAKALILGDKSDMDPEISQAYRSAGVVHVLCVSGMHLGMVSCLLLFLLRGLKGRTGSWIRFGLICVFLWGYALLTGLSASVCRAACMFTFVQAGLCFGRRLPVMRSLLLSAWCLLLIRPQWLLDVGFLLSYLAVGGIVFFMPSVYPALIEKRKYLKKAVSASGVSWAAQCATAPLSLCCFGQFPLYFWIANLVVAPLASVVLPLGLMLGLMSCWALVPEMVSTSAATLLQYGLGWMNGMSLWVEQWPMAVCPLMVSGLVCVGLYGVLYCARQAVAKREKRYLAMAGLLIWVCCVV